MLCTIAVQGHYEGIDYIIFHFRKERRAGRRHLIETKDWKDESVSTEAFPSMRSATVFVVLAF